MLILFAGFPDAKSNTSFVDMHVQRGACTLAGKQVVVPHRASAEFKSASSAMSICCLLDVVVLATTFLLRAQGWMVVCSDVPSLEHSPLAMLAR